MKIRTGFVSNSSSSSFCIVGFIFDKDRHLNKEEGDNVKSEAEWQDIAVELCSDRALSTEYGISRYMDELLIGREIECIRDNTMFGEFRQDILHEAIAAGFRNLTLDDIRIYVDGGYDG